MVYFKILACNIQYVILYCWQKLQMYVSIFKRIYRMQISVNLKKNLTLQVNISTHFFRYVWSLLGRNLPRGTLVRRTCDLKQFQYLTIISRKQEQKINPTCRSIVTRYYQLVVSCFIANQKFVILCPSLFAMEVLNFYMHCVISAGSILMEVLIA